MDRLNVYYLRLEERGVRGRRGVRSSLPLRSPLRRAELHDQDQVAPANSFGQHGNSECYKRRRCRTPPSPGSPSSLCEAQHGYAAEEKTGRFWPRWRMKEGSRPERARWGGSSSPCGSPDLPETIVAAINRYYGSVGSAEEVMDTIAGEDSPRSRRNSKDPGFSGSRRRRP